MGLYRRVIRIKAEDSPNVRLALAQIKAGEEPTGEMLVPGVLPWADYEKRRQTWDKIRQAIGLDAQFWKGAELLMFPPDWLNRAEYIADMLRGRHRVAKAMGVDPAEGSDKTAIAIVDDLGLIEMVSRKTPDTSRIVEDVRILIERYHINPLMVCIDRGGGGKQLSDQLRARGYNCRTVGFGEPIVKEEVLPGRKKTKQVVETKEEKYEYKNRRAQMYGELRELLSPYREGDGFGIPSDYQEIRHQLSPIPLMYDAEGRMMLLPKHKKTPNSNEKTLTELIGHSPDEADALVLAVHAMLHRPTRNKVGGAW